MQSVICTAFEQVSADNGDRIAVYGLSENLTRTFADLWRDFQAMTRVLAGLNLPPASCVVSSVGNRAAFVSLFLACLDRRLALIPLDGHAPWPEVLSVARTFGAAAVVGRTGAADAAATWTSLPGGLSLMRCESLNVGEGSHSCYGESVVLKLTSGSTDRPKAVVSSECNLANDGRHIVEGMGIRRNDVSLAAIPIAHSYGLGNGVMPLLLQGSPLVLRDGFVPGQLAHDIAACGVTVLPGVPFMFDYIRRLGAAVSPTSSVRLLITAGAPIDVETVRFFKRTFGQKVHSFYGTSETGGITFDASEDVSDPLTVGRPLPGTSVTLMASPTAAPGEGRVHVRGDAVAARYALPDDDEPLSAFTGDGFLAGDLARLDTAGNLILTGRVSRFVNIAGRKVHPEEIERVIREMPDVIEASVLGMPCPTRGEMLVACVRQRGSLTAASIRSQCAARLSPHKIPRRIVFTEGIPADARGKMDRRALEALLSRALVDDEA